MARYPQYLEAPLSVEPRDSCLRQPDAFTRCMGVANGIKERLAVAYEEGLTPATRWPFRGNLLRLEGVTMGLIGACHRWMIASPVMIIRVVLSSDLPSTVQPSVES